MPKASNDPVTSSKNEQPSHKCDHCDFISISKHGVSVHMGHTHRKPSNSEDLQSSQNVMIEQIYGNSEVQEEETRIYREISYIIACDKSKSETQMDKDLR